MGIRVADNVLDGFNLVFILFISQSFYDRVKSREEVSFSFDNFCFSYP